MTKRNNQSRDNRTGMTPREHVKYQRELAKQRGRATPVHDTEGRKVGYVGRDGTCWGNASFSIVLCFMPLYNERKHDGLPYRDHVNAVRALRHHVAALKSKGD